jgi:hypothetical protein
MNYKFLCKPLIAAFLVLLLCLVGWTDQKHNSSKVTWEYMTTRKGDVATLNNLGAEGWELVGVQQWDKGEEYAVFFFKRSK